MQWCSVQMPKYPHLHRMDDNFPQSLLFALFQGAAGLKVLAARFSGCSCSAVLQGVLKRLAPDAARGP